MRRTSVFFLLVFVLMFILWGAGMTQPGSNPEPSVICGLSLLLVLVLAPRFFRRVLLPPQKPTLLNSNSIWDPRATGLSVARLLSDTLVKQSRFFYVYADVSAVLTSLFLCAYVASENQPY